METLTFASLAQVQILLVPVGLIPRTLFESYASEIRSFEHIRLGDIPADTKDGKGARFLPNPMSTGHLHLMFPTHPPPVSHSPLSLLRPSHFPLAVIGIATCSQSDPLSALQAQFTSCLADIFPPDGLYPLAKTCFVFEESDGTRIPNAEEKNLPNLMVVPTMMGNRKLHIGTLLGVLCSQILAEFGSVVQGLESPLGNEYLNASVMPLLPPLSELPSPLGSISRGNASNIASHGSQPEISRPTFALNAAPALKRNSTTTSAVTRQQTLNIQSQKKRMSTIGTTSSHARLYKMLGDFFLLAGRIEDASIWYNEAIQLLRSGYDPVWYACTLEGLATAAVVTAWSTGSVNPSPTTTKEPWNEIVDKLTQATALYYRAPVPDSENVHSLLAFLYCGCVLRHSSLLFIVWSSKGWGPPAFTVLLQSRRNPLFAPILTNNEEVKDRLHLEKLSTATGISRSSISIVLAQLHGPWLLHLGPRERVAILELMASAYGCLGYQRKEAYVLREILGCLLDLLVCGREEDGYALPSASTAGLGIQHSPAPLNNFNTLGVRLSENAIGNDSILRLLVHVCCVLGIDLEAVSLKETLDLKDNGSLPSLAEYDRDIFEELREPSGWPELQVGVIREAVAVAEALPDYPAVAKYALSALKTLQAILAPDDQFHLYTTARKAIMTAQRRGESRVIEYWSGRPIVSISIAPTPSVRLPIEKPRSIQTNTGDLKPLLKGMTDPFLYNPRKVTTSNGTTLVVQNELLEFIITLQNPYIFNLELQELSLSTTGVPFDSPPIKVVIPANSLHQVTITGKPLETGILTIRGCCVQAPGGERREYILPLFTTQEEERLSRQRRGIISEIGRFKYPGLTRQFQKAGGKSKSVSTIDSFKFLQCKVVPAQPLLRIRRSSVTHGALMLYNGERSTIRLTLENVSHLPIEFIRLAFEDSTIEPAQKSLAEGNLSVFETYETEYNLVYDPVFSWDQSEAKVIAPNESLPLTLSCVGKVGCTNAVIHISYSHILDPQFQTSDVFYIRQVSYPLMVTVYHMLECQDMAILPFPAYLRGRAVQPSHDALSHVQFSEKAGWCLFSIEVRNSYGSPFDVMLVRNQQGDSATSSTTIPPGAVTRLVLPIRKITLDEETISKPIPTLSDRQFVLTQSGLSQAEERTQRELFWYREALFNCVKGKWNETGGTRSGTLSFRTQRMTLPMLETFRLEIAQISLNLGKGEHVEEAEALETRLQYTSPNEFVSLRSRVTNLLSTSQVLVVDLEVHPSEYVVYEGVLTDLAVGRLDAGQSREITTSFCFLASGKFELNAQVRSIGAQLDEQRVARSHITVIVAE